MSEVGAAAAHRYRDARQAKARRLGEGEDATNVDASSFTPGEPLNADAKTGMRPVSRQARASGGQVTGRCAGGRADRAPRKSGGGLGGESYVNRNAKEANEDRAGRRHDMGLNKGGRAHRAGGGINPLGMFGGLLPLAISEMSGGDNDPDKNSALGPTAAAVGKANGGGINRDSSVFKPDIERKGASFTRRAKQETGSSAVETRLGRASGGRASRADGGPLATPLAAGIGGQGRMNFNFAPNRSQMLADGGRAKAHERYGPGPGPAEHHPGMAKADGGRAGRAYGGRSAEDRQFDEDARETKGEPPPAWSTRSGFTKPSKPAGRTARANGGAAPGPAEGAALGPDTTTAAAPGPSEGATRGPVVVRRQSPRGEQSTRAASLNPGPRYNQAAVQSAIDESNRRGRRIGGNEARMIHAVLKGRQRANFAEGGEVAEGALKQHRAEHKAMGKVAHGDGCACPRCTARKAKGGLLSAFGRMSKAEGGRTARAKGGKAGTKINIIIAPGGANPQPPDGGLPGGMPPNLAIRPPQPAAPMPMPGGAPPAPGAAPMPMPIPMPMGAGAGGPPGMPPRARGGRAPQVRGEPEAGSGSGLGRLQKAEAYGHRSRQGEGLRK